MTSLVSGSEAEQGLQRGHGLPAPIVAKEEFIEINLELIAARAIMGERYILGFAETTG